MDSNRKKELKEQYQSKPIVGGICYIRCSGNQRIWLRETRDIASLHNRFNFAVAIKSCPEPSMREEFTKYGIESFSFTVLEELTKKEEQTDKEFGKDIDLLYELWLEKLQNGELK